MNTRTAEVGPIPPEIDVELGQALDTVRDKLAALEAAEPERADVRSLAEQLASGDPVVAVSEEVVQRLRLGDRELRRRKRRTR